MGLKGADFGDFADRAVLVFTHGASTPANSALTNLAAVARFLREQAGLAQGELAGRIGCHVNAVVAMELGYPTVGALGGAVGRRPSQKKVKIVIKDLLRIWLNSPMIRDSNANPFRRR
jgi:hypothetical protein